MKGENLFILLSPEEIVRFILRVLDTWNIKYWCRRSYGNSWYIYFWLDTSDQPTGCIRTSDHDGVHETSRFTFDVMCWAARDGAHGIQPVTYPKLLRNMAVRFDRELSPLCLALLKHGKEHAIELQKNSRHRAWRPTIRKARLYLKTS